MKQLTALDAMDGLTAAGEVDCLTALDAVDGLITAGEVDPWPRRMR